MSMNSKGLGFTISATDLASAVLDKVNKALGRLTGSGKSMTNNLDDAWNRLGSVGQALKGMGMTGIGYLGGAVEASGKFESAIARVMTIADATEFPINRVRDAVMGMAQQFGGDLETQAGALYMALSSGAYKAADAMNVMNAANKLAVGGQSTVDKTMMVLMGTLSAYGMSMDKATMVTDRFFQAVNLGGSDLSIETLSTGLGRVAPTAALMNMSLDELTGTLARLTLAGIKSDEAITGIKAMMDQIIKPSKNATEEAKRLGIAFDSAAVKSMGFEKFMMSIISSPKLAADSMEKLFGSSTEALNAAATLSGDKGAKFVEFLNQIKNSGGATDKAFKTMSETMGFMKSVMDATWQTMKVGIGDAIAPLLGYLAVLANSIMAAFNKLPKGVKNFLVYAATFASIFAVIVGTVLSATAAIGAFIAAIAAIGLEALAIALTVVMNVLQVLSIWFAVAALAAAGFYVAIDKNVGGLGTYITGVFSRVSEAFQVLVALFEGNGQLTGPAAQSFMDLGSNLQAFVTTIWTYWQRIKAFTSGVSSSFSTAIEAMAPAISSLVNSFQDLGEALGFTQGSAEENAASFDAWAAMGKTVGAAIADAFGLVVQAIQIVTDYWAGFITVFRESGALSSLGAAVASIVDAFASLGAAFGSVSIAGEKNRTGWQMLGMAIGAVASVVVGLIAVFIRLVAGAIQMATSIIGGVASVLSGVVGIYMGFATMLHGLFTGNWGEIWQGLLTVVFGVAEAIVGAVASMVSQIAALIDTLAAILGKDLGLKKLVEGAKKDMLGDLKVGLGLTTQAPAAPGAASTSQIVSKSAMQSLPAAPAMPFVGPPTSAMGAAQAAGGSPAVATAASSGGGGGNIDALAAKLSAPAPIQLNIQNRLELDGQVLADNIEKYQSSSSNRSFGPSSTSKG